MADDEPRKTEGKEGEEEEKDLQVQKESESSKENESDKEFDSVFERKRHIGFAAIVVVAFIAGFFFNPAITGNIIINNPNQVANDIINYINANLIQDGEMSLVSVSEVSGLYKITGYYQGNQINFYSTKDGKFFIPPGGMIDTSELRQTQPSPAPADIPKADRPNIELFVMSYCPYGTQIEKGILPVIGLLGDKVNFTVKFVYYAMHGKKELDEQLIQYCIQKNFNNKYIDYLSCFLKDGDSRRCLSDIEIEQSKLDTCISETDKQYSVTELYNNSATWLSGRFPLFNVHKADNEKYGVSGSPTLIINGQKVSTGRDPESLKQAICAAFNTPPAECSQRLSSAQPSPGFGFSTTSTASAGSYE